MSPFRRYEGLSSLWLGPEQVRAQSDVRVLCGEMGMVRRIRANPPDLGDSSPSDPFFVSWLLLILGTGIILGLGPKLADVFANRTRIYAYLSMKPKPLALIVARAQAVAQRRSRLLPELVRSFFLVAPRINR